MLINSSLSYTFFTLTILLTYISCSDKNPIHFLFAVGRVDNPKTKDETTLSSVSDERNHYSRIPLGNCSCLSLVRNSILCDRLLAKNIFLTSISRYLRGANRCWLSTPWEASEETAYRPERYLGVKMSLCLCSALSLMDDY